jgi:phage-related protein
MAARNISATVQIGATMASSVGSVFGGIKKQIDGLGASMAKLKKSSGEITKLQAAQGKLAQAQAKGNTTAAKRYQGEVDKLTASLRAAGVDTSKLTQEQARLNRQLEDGQRRMANLTRLNSSVRGLGTAFGSLKTAMGGALMRLGVVGGVAAGAVAGVAALTTQFVNLGDALADEADSVGMSTQALQTWQFAAADVGVEANALLSSVARLQRGIADGGEKTEAAFKTLGINFERFKKLEPDAQMSVLSEAFKNYSGNANLSAVAMDLFGKSGFKLLPVLKRGQEGFEAMNEAARETGFILSDEVMAEMAKADAAANRFKLAFIGLKNKALAPMLPLFTRFAEMLGGIIRDHGPAFTAWAERVGTVFLTSAIPAIAAFVANDLPGLVQGLGETIGAISSTVSWLSQAVGGWTNLGAILLGLNFAPVILALGGVVKALWGIGAASIGILGPWGLLIGAVIAGAAAVVYYWEPIKDFFKGLWEGVVTVSNLAWEHLMDGVRELRDAFLSVWESIKAGVGRVIDWMSGKINSLLGVFERVGGFMRKITGAGDGDFYAPPGAAKLDAAGIPGGSIMPADRMPAAGGGGTVNNQVEVKIDARGADGAEVERKLRSALQSRPLYDQTGVLAPQ